ncbi:MAG: hypothetical protein KDA86_26565 [Planctomycetaceae bacterium]|nr:hypothetical protein [Planctomycetaceae bacterium]
MKPTGPSDTRQFDLFRASLRQILDPEHPLLSLAAKPPECIPRQHRNWPDTQRSR